MAQIDAIQLDIAWEDKAANFARVRSLVADAEPAPDSLIILPEMFATGFSMNLAATRQSAAREDETFLAELAREHRAFVLGGVVAPGRGGGARDKGLPENGRAVLGRNDAVAYSPTGELLARYTKIHPFSLGGEDQGHEVGTEIVTFAWQGFTVAPFVCYDLRFPEIFRAAVRAGANLFVLMGLWPVKRQQHWLTLLQARAIENQAWVIGVNRVGTEPQFTYAGRSVVINPHGIIIADAGESERVLRASLDLESMLAWRRDFPALRDAHWRG